MYVNPDFKADTGQAHDLMERWPFAVVIALDPDVRLSFVPVELRRDQGPNGTLVGHVSAADPVAGALRHGTALRVAFTGPVAYVSPAWYADQGLPTYNFGAVEAAGTARPLDDPKLVKRHLMALVKAHEGARTDGLDRWRPDGWARRRTDELLGELQAFEMPIDRLEVKLKIGQNRSPGDRLGTIAGLEAAHHVEAAALMRARYGCPH
ncbi:FMN-binding negative transcriptional regulator [Nonomuraea endophytica]|uniref:Transcriptional regulator n=1 Tax=Nonomuraea endophytica TaxID=714136 RepID=A0A7W7ZZ32_9ACTN|nr:FMN-binding negative transcriptional regulator [Nonomuraea endophytica]MBB5076477.1 transcriptional regulator [Nonomuraea endophytica]